MSSQPARRAGWGALHASLNPDYRNQSLGEIEDLPKI